MTNVTKQISKAHVLDHARAANADQIGDAEALTKTVVETESTASGWDSYQVWRRFIKEARERRRSES